MKNGAIVDPHGEPSRRLRAGSSGLSPRLRCAISVIAILISAPAALGRAQDAGALRQQGRAALREGRFEDAAELFGRAAEHSNDPTVWLEVGDVADRLRRDEIALHAYQTYLERRPDAPDHAEISARVRILVPRVHERDRLLVDWEGGSVSVQRRPMPLADWDGELRSVPRGPRELMPLPDLFEVGLGHRLATP